VNMIPYGIAVINLNDVIHYNEAFGKALSLKNSKKVKHFFL